MSEEPILKIEYVNLWMQQSQLFWSRLQTATALHTGILVVWFYLSKDEDWSWLSPFLLGLGIVLSSLILIIMWRDGKYMDAMKDKAGKEVFPHPKCKCPIGRFCAAIMLVILMVVEVCLLVMK
ncbi:MAG: hypothetical protein Q7R95_02325 [bacterium]|nr:hypothetical protein [bacterium]